VQVPEAKNFLVQQTAQQAQLENTPLSDLEKRMMYIREEERGDEELTPFEAEFYARYDHDQYERKISQLLNHARKRYKRETPDGAQFWDESIRTLSQGDHYLLDLWDKSHARMNYLKDRAKLLSVGLFLLLTLLLLIFLAMILDASRSPATHGHFPIWLQRCVLGAMGITYLLCLLFPRKLGTLLDKTIYKLSQMFGSKQV